MHTFIIGNDGTYIIGFLMVQKTNGTQSFVPLFDVKSRTDAAIAINALNGGNANALQGIDITQVYTEGASPQIKVPVGVSAELPAEAPTTDTS